MRIAIISEGYLPELNGVCISLHERLKCFSRLGYEVQVYIPDYSHLSDQYPDYKSHLGSVMPGITVIPYPSKLFAPRRMCFAKPNSFKTVESSIKLFSPDIIHVECPERLFSGFLTRPGIALANRLNIPATAFYHTNYIPCIKEYSGGICFFSLPKIEILLKKIVAWIYNSYKLTMVPSKTSMAYLKNCGIKNCIQGRFLGVDKDKFKNRIHDIGIEKKISSLRKKTKILYVGRIDKEKQISNLIKVFDAVRKKSNNKCGFIIVGGGEEEQKVKTWASKHDDVVFAGPVSNSETSLYYSIADIFVTASPIENYPLTVLEAMASGIPVVGPDQGGVGELIQHGKTGLSVKPYSVKAIADSILQLVNNASLRKEMSRNSLLAVNDFSWENSALKMINVWQSLLRDKGKVPDMDYVSQSAGIQL
ncbi:MAG: glycosyltransferase [Clostridia bacterium]|nr:glycosyltransferase [Clostridia bacterium]